jgi:hypothetical protein
MGMSRGQDAGRSYNIDSQFLRKGGTFQIFGNKPKQQKFHSGRNYEQIEVRECLLAFGAESFVFQCAIHKYKN